MAARPRASYAEVQDERKDRARGAVREGFCQRCRAPVLRGETRPPLSVKVEADGLPLVGELEAHARAHGLMTWCLRRSWMSVAPERLMWRCAGGETCQREHDVVAEHRCSDRKGRYKISMSDIYGSKRAARKRPEVERGRWGWYKIKDPRTGEVDIFQRVTTFCKITTDQKNLTDWQLRVCAKGLSKREDLVALAATYDVTEDSKKFNELCETAKEAGGGKSAANTGTALHGMAEEFDFRGDLQEVPAKYRPRILQYAAALEDHGIQVVDDMIERTVIHTGYEVAGTFDRIFRLQDGSYVIGDMKTGKNLDYAKNEIAVQCFLYAAGFNAHGVWDPEHKRWEDPGFKVREDIALVVHLPANNPDECTMYRSDLAGTGKRGAALCHEVKAYRKAEGALVEFTGAAPSQDAKGMFSALIAKARDRSRLIEIRDDLRAAGLWSPQYAALCKARAAEIEDPKRHDGE